MRADQVVLSQEARNAIRAFRDSKPWRGTEAERGEKFKAFHDAFAEAAGLETSFHYVAVPEQQRGGGYLPETNQIVLGGRLSVVTMFFCLGLAVGLDRNEALKWARDRFKHFFPRSWRGCDVVNGLVVKRGERPDVADLEDGAEEE